MGVLPFGTFLLILVPEFRIFLGHKGFGFEGSCFGEFSVRECEPPSCRYGCIPKNAPAKRKKQTKPVIPRVSFDPQPYVWKLLNL